MSAILAKGVIVNMNIGDYKGVSEAHLAVARHFSSPALLGPPMCDELLALVEHMFTEEEAEIVRFIPPLKIRTAGMLARSSGRRLEEVDKILYKLAYEKYVILAVEKAGRKFYSLMPLLPGTFEEVLLRTNPDSVTPWHKKFAELHERLYNTGYNVRYYNRDDKALKAVRYLPVGESIEGNQMAYPSDRLEEVLEPYSDFSVGICQCRLSKELLGEGCGKKLEACLIMGPLAKSLVSQGRMRAVSRQEAIDIKREAESEGLITWMLNVDTKIFNVSCSCCGCCCDALRSVTQFNTPGLIAPPHFMPDISFTSCRACMKCVNDCPMGALKMLENESGNRLSFDSKRCVGCGLCSLACKDGLIRMEAVENYSKPKGVFGYLAQTAPHYLKSVVKERYLRR